MIPQVLFPQRLYSEIPLNKVSAWLSPYLRLTYSIHDTHVGRMGPEAVMHRRESRPRPLTIQRGKHHVRGV